MFYRHMQTGCADLRSVVKVQNCSKILDFREVSLGRLIIAAGGKRWDKHGGTGLVEPLASARDPTPRTPPMVAAAACCSF